jgi:cell division protein FtsL
MTVVKQPRTDVRAPEPPPRVRRYRSTPEPRSRVSTAIIYIVVAVLITAVGLLYLIQTNHVAGLGYEMSQLQRERSALALRNEQLNYSVAKYESLAAVESVAIGQVGMTQTDDFMFMSVPRPAHDQLLLPQPQPSGDMSFVERIWQSLSGSATATSVPSGESVR